MSQGWDELPETECSADPSERVAVQPWWSKPVHGQAVARQHGHLPRARLRQAQAVTKDTGRADLGLRKFGGEP